MDLDGAPLKRRGAILARLKEHPLARVGPGLITGVADDDPSGIATYSQAGAQFGLNMLWTMPLAFPLMAAVQCMCANLGRVTGKGLAANIKGSFSPAVLYGVVLLLLAANTLNIAADVAAMGEVAQLVLGVDRHVMTVCFVFATLLLQIFVPYHRYVFFLKWLTVSLLAYAAVLFVVHVPWREVALRTLWPHFALNANAAATVVAVFGTTISPYLFFWQASEEVEDMHAHAGGAPLVGDPRAARVELRRIRWDTWSGMLYSDITAYFIILATAVTLHVAGVTDIDTAAQAASALRPLAGDFAYLLFALGILGVGFIGVPVLAGSGAYALAEAMNWPEGLERKPRDARGFYGIIAVSVLAALAIQYSPISPMKALFWSAVINGVVAVPLLVVILLLVSKRTVMGDFTASRPLLVLGSIAAAVMGAAAVMMLLPR
ncbi:NRAMP family divalent metal transporter [Paraburkholderia fungorum]|uniref:Mn2+/Fe2+ NRAMP family transporter n=1 Tax=Paraburkholderia fungorum TaxID=134537 RepID=A0AAW3UWZ4_9BURK|nr:divalent metal cation transporter [Paraburkholderia fungorum]MBB4514960.1 Mn2+/Fe2+ NRAMP family transporter [Paraburkholderia fungorum]MBB6202904.1 Mn2+/Fe2+ NRAMP family transporter [Paraburkholderia fungorum]